MERRGKSGRGRPPSGQARTPAERMRRMRERRKAQGLIPVTRWVAKGLLSAPYSDHRRLDLRSLAMHAVIAKKIARDQSCLKVAQDNLLRWGARCDSDVPYWHVEWQAILKRPWREIAAFLTDPGEVATRLRQSSPFAGVLSPAERKSIYDAFRA
jgi:hypothetical protein